MSEYCLYLRKSRADIELEQHGEHETLARHETLLLELAKKLNLNITMIYREVVSGETIASRPVMQTLLQEVENGVWAGVLVMEIERLARGDTIDQGIMAQAFKYSGTKIITPIKTYDPENEFDEEYFEFNLFMSRREYKTINRRIQRGRVASAKEGKFLSSVAPYGYNKVKIANDKGFTLEPHPEQSEVIKMIFDWYVNGELKSNGTVQKLGATLIAKKLDSLNVKPMVNERWSATSIRDILKNPVYIGQIRWSYRKEIKKVKDGMITKTRPDPKDNNYILVKGLHPALISEDLYNKAQMLMSSRIYTAVRSDQVLQNPLSGLIYCELCGSLMTRLAPNSRNKYSTLKCPNHYCSNISAPLHVVENKVISALAEFLDNYTISINASEEEISSTISEKQIKSIENEIATIEKQISNTYDLLEQGIYDTDTFLNRNKILNEKKNQLVENYNATIEAQEKLMKFKNSNSFIPTVEKVLSGYYLLESAGDKNELLKYVLERIEYRKDVRNKKGQLENDNFSITLFPKIPKI